GDTPVWLPVDAKFPIDAYSALLEAQEGTDKALADAAVRTLEQRVRGFAKDIHTKYIHVPDTTDFGIMFLPFEGLYAEVVRRGMMEKLQTEYKVIVAGPTTMAALLNSLQMGFRTLAIQKSSSEVWKVLGNVKSEFDMFGKVLTSAQSRINQANDELEKLVGVRTRQIQRRLSQVSNLSQPSDALSEDPDLLTETLLSSVI
ncbi:MAG: DNA recombination protein RmuC, partial [Ruthenibacterium sp.]